MCGICHAATLSARTSVEYFSSGLKKVFSRKRQMMQSLTASGGALGPPKAERWIPKPDIPVAPVLSLAALFAADDAPVPALLDVGKPLFLTAGRMAIAQALGLMGIAPGDKILMPAFHCPAMVAPLSMVGAEPVFYRLNPDLTIDLDDIAAKLGPRVRAVVAINYFGFPNRLVEIREFCDAHGLAFLEDCAHSLFGEYEGRPLGSFGHYAIASATKFFPVRDGGYLVSEAFPEKLASLELDGQLISTQLRQAIDTIEEATFYRRLSLFRPLFAIAKPLKALLRLGIGLVRRTEAAEFPPGSLHSGALDEFDAALINIRGTKISAAIGRSASRQRVAEQRRRHFETFLAAFSGHRGFRPLFEELPDSVVPFMFPLYVDDLETVFPQLEDLAIPMQRFGQFLWPDGDEQRCLVSMNYSQKLVQFPCHQELTDAEVRFIADSVLEVLGVSSS